MPGIPIGVIRTAANGPGPIERTLGVYVNTILGGATIQLAYPPDIKVGVFTGASIVVSAHLGPTTSVSGIFANLFKGESFVNAVHDATTFDAGVGLGAPPGSPLDIGWEKSVTSNSQTGNIGGGANEAGSWQDPPNCAHETNAL